MRKLEKLTKLPDNFDFRRKTKKIKVKHIYDHSTLLRKYCTLSKGTFCTRSRGLEICIKNNDKNVVDLDYSYSIQMELNTYNS